MGCIHFLEWQAIAGLRRETEIFAGVGSEEPGTRRRNSIPCLPAPRNSPEIFLDPAERLGILIGKDFPPREFRDICQRERPRQPHIRHQCGGAVLAKTPGMLQSLHSIERFFSRLTGFAMLASLSATLAAAEATVTVAADARVQAGTLVGVAKKGDLALYTGSILHANTAIGEGDFMLDLRLTLEKMDGTGASIALNDAHIGFDSSPEKTLFIAGGGFGETTSFPQTQNWIQAGKPADIRVVRKSGKLTLMVNGHKLGLPPFGRKKIESIALCSRSNVMKIDSFRISGDLAPLTLTKSEIARLADPDLVTPAWPASPPAEWLTYHLSHPGPGHGFPADPNFAFYYKGRYHLHYIYQADDIWFMAHVSSEDMIHWKWHPTVLSNRTTGHGLFSGTGFFTIGGKPAIIYQGFVKNDINDRSYVQFALDDDLDCWSEPVVAEPQDAQDKVPGIFHYDPDCWVRNGTYYGLLRGFWKAQAGLRSPKLMKSNDLRNWDYLGEFFHENYPANLGIGKDEDVACANVFQLGNKWVLLALCHPRGAGYYIGDFKDEKYLPEFYARLNWKPMGEQYRHGFFAPESCLTSDGRRVMWCWLRGMSLQPEGVQSLPRVLELPADGVLRMRPAREIDALRYDPKSWEPVTVKPGADLRLDGLTGDALELEVTFAAPLPKECGLHLLTDENGDNGMSIRTGDGLKTMQLHQIQPTFEPKPGEDVTFRIYIDKNLVELYANDRQAAVTEFEHYRENPHIRIFSEGGDLKVKSIKAWKMKSIY